MRKIRASSQVQQDGATDGQVLTWSDEIGGWRPEAASGASTAVGVRAYRTTGQAISHNVVTAIELDGENFDTSGFHDNVTNNSRLTVPTSLGGVYQIVAQIAYPPGAGSLHAVLRLNGVTDLAEAQLEGNASRATKILIGDVEQLVAGDYVTLLAYQTTGVSLTVAGARSVTFAAMTRVGA